MRLYSYEEGLKIILEAKQKLSNYVKDISVFPYILHAWQQGMFGQIHPKQDPIKILASKIFDAYNPVPKEERKLFHEFLPQLMELSETEEASYYLTCVLVDFTKIDKAWYVKYADRLKKDFPIGLYA